MSDDGSDTPSVPPNRAWVEKNVGNRVQLSWPDEDYVVAVQGTGGDE